MKKIFLAAWLLTLALPLARAEEEGFELSVDPQVYSEDAFRDVEGVKVKALPEEEPARAALPTAEARNEAFAKVPGLAASTAGFDALAKDKLYVRARINTAKELRKYYPQIPAKQLQSLQKVLR